MKIFILVAFCTAAVNPAAAQPAADTTHFSFTPRFDRKAVVYLNNDSVAKGTITSVDENSLILSSVNGTGNTQEYSIPVTSIQSIKIKRGKLWTGLGGGGLLGGFLGYWIGAGTYVHDYSISESDNTTNKIVRGWTGAAISILPSAVIGAILNTILAKTQFLINGNRNNMKKTATKLWSF